MNVGVNADRRDSQQVACCCIIADHWTSGKSVQCLSEVRGDAEEIHLPVLFHQSRKENRTFGRLINEALLFVD